MTKKAQISMTVWNDFRNDARVLKEAETLQAAGHQVTVYALLAPGQTCKHQTLASGVRVVRVTRFFRTARLAKRQMEAASTSVQDRRSPVIQPKKAMTESGSPDRSPRQFGAIQLVGRLVTRGAAHIFWLVKLVKARPHVVHAHDVNTLPTAWVAAKLTRARLVYDAHEISVDREGYRRVRKLVGWVEKKLMPRINAAITTTDTRAKFFAWAYKVPRPLVLQNRPRFEPATPSNRLRKELDLREDWPIVLYQGGLQAGRGLLQLAEAGLKMPAAYIVFIGGGRTEPELHQFVQQAELEERVRFIPTVPLDQLASYTRSADIGVQPIENTCLNHYTTDSNKLFEYLMAGLPIVASSMPEIRKVVQKYDCGLLVPPGDGDALARSLLRLAEDEALRQRLAAGARRAALEYNWEAQEQLLVDLYARLTGGNITKRHEGRDAQNSKQHQSVSP